MFVRPYVWDDAMARKARVGDTLVMPLRTNQAIDSNQVISGAAILGGLYTRSGTNTNRTDTTITGTALAALVPEMDTGDTMMFMVGNLTTGSMTIAGGVDVTASGNLVVLTLTHKFFLIERTGAITFTMLGL